MAKRKTKRRITYRKRRRSTRKGQVRKTARRAYRAAPKRRARRNPKPLLQQPAIRFVAWGSLGAGLGLALEQSKLLVKVENVWARSAIAAAVTFMVARMLKGRSKANLTAVAAGMLLPPVAGAISDAVSPAIGQLSLPTGNGNGVSSAELAVRRARLAARSNPHAVAQAHARSARKNVLV
jgi:hypothetical protein